jgi:hypothetical protein
MSADAISNLPPNPFYAGSAAVLLVALISEQLAGSGWEYVHDGVAWTATRNDPAPEVAEQWVRVEDGTRYGQGPTLTAVADNTMTVIRYSAIVDRAALSRGLDALHTQGVLPDANGRYA